MRNGNRKMERERKKKEREKEFQIKTNAWMKVNYYERF